MILQTKYRLPNIPANLVQRSGVIKQRISPSTKIVSLIAPAGYGKSTLLLQWLHRKKAPIAWCSIDESDNHIEAFLSLLIYAIYRAIPPLGDPAYLSANIEAAYPEETLTVIVNKLNELNTPLTIVLDDVHLIEEPLIHKQIQWFSKALPPRVMLCVTSREKLPYLPVKLHLNGALVEISKEDLLFTQDQLEILTKRIAPHVSAVERLSVMETSEGWISAIRILLMTNATQSFTKPNDTLLPQFIFNELFTHLSPLKQQIIELLIPFSRFSFSLLQSLSTTDLSEAWNSLLKENLFITSLDDGWYRFHHLIPQTLSDSCNQNDRTAALKKGAKWFYKEKLYKEACMYALSAHDITLAMEAYEQIGSESWHHKTETEESQILSQFPESAFTLFPQLLLYRWKEHMLMRRLEAITEELDKYTSLLDNLPAPLLGRLYVLKTHIAHFYCHMEEAELYADKALSNLAVTDYFWRYSLLAISGWNLFFNNMGDSNKALERFYKAREAALQQQSLIAINESSIWEIVTLRFSGELDEAEKRLHILEARLKEGKHFDSALASLFYIEKGEIAHMRGDFTKAYELEKKGYTLSHEGNALIHQWNCGIRLAGLCLSMGKIDETEELLLKSRLLRDKFRLVQWQEVVDITLEALIIIAKNDTKGAMRWIERNNIEKQILSSVNESLFLAYGALCIFRGDTSRAIDIIAKTIQFTEQSSRVNIEQAGLMLLTLAHIANREESKAKACLNKYLSLAQNTGIINHVISYFPFIKELWDTVKREESNQQSLILLMVIEKKVEERSAFNHSAPTISLSPREHDLLKHLAQGHSNRKIGELLFISENTVKSHLKRLHVKLDVSTRTEAVTRAREIGILI